MNKEATLLMLAMDNLPPQLHGESTLVANRKENHCFNDAEVILKARDKTYHFDVEIKHIHRKESLAALLPFVRPDTLLICNRLSPFLADFCSEHSINFIDNAGNARVTYKEFNLWVEGKRPLKSFSSNSPQAKPGVGFMKLLFALLVKDETLHLPYRDIANLANISLGMVSKGVQYLVAEKLISQGSSRDVLDQAALYRLWFEYYRTVLRPKLGGIKLDAPSDWRDIPLNQRDCWGGEVAADELTQYLQPYELQLFTFEPLQKKLAQLKAKPNTTGKLWLVPAFWGQELQINNKAKALLAIAELLASNDSRNREVAGQINEQYLHLKTFP
ncbi:hypothetical protein LZP69_08375 [Shewanella sp. AS1]|uniref:type IV toxin-antitoxin system AbiEi family antitoxin n=1 Tax=Shewanella sp. AS1 TaxID=2907626 RepID=UPI001F1E6727|nr:type IV toxin-antitoxin system AbiEi family antitoxin [Shewanella sp. AS1]MCE9679188.1 hypothetical protein [Shewanella sp. AS1]